MSHRPQAHDTRDTTARAARAFTLVELMVVVSIFLIMSIIALPLLSPYAKGRKLREGARIVQAVLMGARDLALREGENRGLIFRIDRGSEGNTIEYSRPVGTAWKPVDFIKPVRLPDGVYFDFSLSGSSDTDVSLATEVQRQRYIVFNARGTAEGPGLVHIFLKEGAAETSAANIRERIVVTLYCQTGLIQVYEYGASGSPFEHAQHGRAAGR